MSEGPKMAEKQPLLGGVLSVYRSDLRHLRSKALWYGILSQFKHKEALAEMDAGKKWSVLAGLKSLIECFDEII